MTETNGPAGRAEIWIAGQPIGPGNPLFAIAEVGNAHDGNLNSAHAFIDAVAGSGVQAIKFQTHIADAESTPREPFRVKFSHVDATRFDYWRRMEFSESEWRGLAEHCEERGLVFLSSPFSPEAVALLDRIGCPAWKVASGETNNTPLLECMIETGKPLLISTGMSYLAELEQIAKLCEARGAGFALFQCTSAYPCPPERVGLNLIGELRERFGCPVGLSDHSGEIYTGVAATALGDDLIEVHVCFGPDQFGPDTSASLTPSRLAELVEGARAVRAMVESPLDKDAMAREFEPMRALFCKSVVAARDLAAGTVLGSEHLAGKKPGDGIPVERTAEFLGRRLVRDVERNHPLTFEDIE